MEKKTYKAPTLRVINIAATEILAGSVIGDINTGNNPPSENDNYDIIGGYDKELGGWGYGSPD